MWLSVKKCVFLPFEYTVSVFFFFQAEDGIRDYKVTGVQTCALPILFSREPTWSWGHDGQVFHESIVMQAYAFMDAQSAQDSQRVFMDRQRSDGYIGYRIGPYVTRTFPHDGEDTSSAPFFSWTNWEIYRVSHDRKFLADAYRSGALFAEYILRTRDKDGDGFLEWGGNAMLENVRDSLDVIWSLFGGDDDSPKRVKALPDVHDGQRGPIAGTHGR